MFSVLRRRLTFANVAMTVALVFAMSGGAYAASKFLITSTKQIKPSVLASLKGKAGATGPAGAAGAVGSAGPQGPAGAVGPQGAAGATGETGAAGAAGAAGKNGTNGKEGSPWTAGGTLPSGKSETGMWAIGAFPEVGHSSNLFSSISFPIPLATGVKVKTHIFEGTTAPEGCSLSGGFVEATAGNLCIWIAPGGTLKVEPSYDFIVYDPENEEEGAGRAGAVLAADSQNEGVVGFGVWAVTAP